MGVVQRPYGPVIGLYSGSGRGEWCGVALGMMSVDRMQPSERSRCLHILSRPQAQLSPIVLAELSAQLVQARHCHEGIHRHQVVVHLRP